MKGQVRGQGKVRQTIFWWPGGFCPLHLHPGTPLHGKLHQKKVPISCFPHEFNLDAIEKNYSQDPPLSIHLKSHTLPPCVVCM